MTVTGPSKDGRRCSKTAPEKTDILINLSRAQIDQVISELTGHSLSEMLEADDLLFQRTTRVLEDLDADNQSLSRSLLVGLQIFGACAPVDSAQRLTEIADKVNMPPSSVYRYARTLNTIGLLQQTSRHKYRIPTRTPDERTPGSNAKS
jgi:IclR helix-turn-helix domain